MSFYNQIPNRTYGTGEIYCYTYDGNTLIGVSFATFRASAGDVKPIVELSVVENDETVKSVTGGSYLLQYTSDAKYTIDATALYGATIESYSITNGSTTYTTPTGVFEDVVDEYYTVIVTDSRGLSTTLETRKVTNKYVKVTCNLSLQNLDTEDGSVTKYIFFDSPQYTVDGYIVDAYYWIGTFNKQTCKFIPDDPKPKLFDLFNLF